MWCFHDRFKQFTFSELAGGETIKMCPDCTAFDTHRVGVLKTGEVYKTDMETQVRWDIVLDKAGLGEDVGKYDWLLYDGDLPSLPNAHPNTRFEIKRTLYTAIDDQLWQQRQKPFPHTRSMPRLLTNFCVTCKAYLPVNHMCEIK